MDENESNPNEKHDVDDVLDEQKRTEGQSAHQGDLAGPSSDDAGKVQAPQKGDPRADDRRG